MSGSLPSAAHHRRADASGAGRLDSRRQRNTTAHALAASYLRAGGWDRDGISNEQVDAAEQWVLAASKWDVAGGWRARLYGGELWVKMLKVEPHWAERTSVLRLVLAAVAQKPQLAAFDVVYVHNDRDPAPRLSRVPARSVAPRPAGDRSNWPLLTNAHEQGRRSLPLPDYSFAGWHTHTAPWCTLAQRMQDGATLAGPWDNRTDLAFFSGNLRIGTHRKQLRRLSLNASDSADVLLVRDVGSTFFVPGSGGGPGRGTSPPLPMHRLCAYRYLISVPGFGYSNRLKSLLSCESVVIHVRTPWDEFFMPQLQHERHLYVVPTVADIIPAVHRLRANPALARRIARAGANYARHHLSFGRVLGYVQQLLAAVGHVSAPPRPPDANYTRVASARDLARIAQLCDCGTAKRPTRQRCAAQFGLNATRAEPATSRARGASFERLRMLRCCEGWDCSQPVCEGSRSVEGDGGVS